MAIANERLAGMLTAYIENDAASADTGYIREVLRDELGMTKEEAEELVLLWVYGEEE